MSESTLSAKEYLVHHGYIKEDSRSPSELEAAIKLFQSNYGLKATGALDADTVALMRQSRCSVADVVGGVNTVARGRSSSSNSALPSSYQLFPVYPRWSRFDLLYTLVDFPEVARPAIQSALQRWSQVSSFTFTEIPGPLPSPLPDPLRRHLEIGFYRGDHEGCRFQPDELAHSFRPPDGRLHFDADQPWSFVDGTPGVDFESVAVHEMGHVLGLDHSQFSRAAMYSTTLSGEVRRELNPDDILGIRVLYRGVY